MILFNSLVEWQISTPAILRGTPISAAVARLDWSFMTTAHLQV
ncbi:MAG: hypothetical protein RLZZ375_335 [Pseudomonadota bacterium]|jgi:hypothetical protein